jgi:glycosyltransferase involved in cell wall biosynthesis/putative flippase GtrA
MKSRAYFEPMREREPLRVMPTLLAFEATTPKPRETNKTHVHVASTRKTRGKTIWQFVRFVLVGCMNTMIDLLVLNGLLWLWPEQGTARLLLFNTIAYACGALNSFVFNRYWTFQREGPPNAREGARFLLVTLAAIACNDLILWLMSTILHPVHLTPTLWTNVSKVVAIGSTILLSYLGMRLWVFVQSSHEKLRVFGASFQRDRKSSLPESTPITSSQQTTLGSSFTTHSLSVVLPAYNEEQVIASTVEQVTHELANLTTDFEVIVVNDGSTDRTGAVLSALQKLDRRIRVLTHTCNQGYGATLADGFAAAKKDLTFFMDSDGQFDIRELKRFLSLIDAYDAVIGYRVKRQDTWMRKLNAWGWKFVVKLALGVRVRDIDCAFKLLRTDFLQRHPLETRGAMINAELLYRLKVSGCTLREVEVRHLRRRGGRATGANLRVIGRAFRELFVYTRTWRHEELASQNAADHGFFKGNTGALIHTDHIGVTTFFPARILAAAIDALRDRAEEMT